MLKVVRLENVAVDDPQIRLVSRPLYSTKAIIFIHGGWSQKWGCKDEDYRKLISGLDRAGWKDAIYHLWWDSSESFQYHRLDTIKSRAKEVGKYYFSSLVASRIPEKEISVLAFSFGARVTYYALEAWSRHNHTLQDAILMAGAVKRDSSKHWSHVSSKLNGQLINIYSGHDSWLEWLEIWQGGTSPCGLKPIKERHPKIVNISANNQIGRDHSLSRYLEYLPSFINLGV